LCNGGIGNLGELYERRVYFADVWLREVSFIYLMGCQERESLFLDRKWGRKGVIYFPRSIDKLEFSDYVYIPF